MKRVGHTGTLDPGAAGVLPICLGRATRLFDYLVDKEKEYYAEVAFGCATDTQDSYGTVIACGEGIVRMEKLQAVLPAFIGEIEQVAPMYSAVCVDGKRLYQLAREGAEEIRKHAVFWCMLWSLLRRREKTAFAARAMLKGHVCPHALP